MWPVKDKIKNMEDLLLHNECALLTLSTEKQHLQQDKEDTLHALSTEKEQKQAELLC